MVIGLVWLSIGVFSRLPMGATEPSDWIAGNMESIVALYRHFHVKTTSKTTSASVFVRQTRAS
jgi:hypothetical protein